MYGLIIALAFLITSCSAPVDLGQLATDVQKQTSQLCSFVPTVQTILDLYNQKVPELKTATDITAAVCKLVNTVAATPAGERAQPKIGDVPIDGYVVSK
jgi:hypothetical protein